MDTATSIYPRSVSRIGALTVIICLAATALLLGLLRLRLHRAPEAVVDLRSIPLQIGEWKGTEGGPLGLKEEQILQLDHYVRRTYSKATGEQVFLYVGYWKHQTGESQAAKHSPVLCLPANGWKIDRLSRVSFNGEPAIKINRVVGEFNRQKTLFFYWFFNGNEYYVEEWESLARVMFNAFLGRRTDGGIIEVTAPAPSIGGAGKAEEALNEFIGALMPYVDSKVR